jgi:arylsulfatase A-like enzyme
MAAGFVPHPFFDFTTRVGNDFSDEALRFTDFHVSPTCSPTRAALITGRHQFRNGATDTLCNRSL